MGGLADVDIGPSFVAALGYDGAGYLTDKARLPGGVLTQWSRIRYRTVDPPWANVQCAGTGQ
jgi:hypothetical protein